MRMYADICIMYRHLAFWVISEYIWYFGVSLNTRGNIVNTRGNMLK